MTAQRTTAPRRWRAPARRHLRLVPEPTLSAPGRCSGVHVEAPCDYRLRLVEFDDGVQISRFECDACGSVIFR